MDYRQFLNPKEFEVYVRLRDLRKSIAREDSVPLYTVGTNDPLGKMAQLPSPTKKSLRKIEGFGEARMDKNGERILRILSTSVSSMAAAAGLEKSDAANEEPAN